MHQCKLLKKVKYHPCKVDMIHEIVEADFEQRTEFFKYKMNQNNRNNNLIC